jgi:asparagine synthase (glutamine-hydrolysing)
MCGLAGYIDLRNERLAELTALERMTSAIAHRGPDSYGYFIEQGVALGFRRLSIIDRTTGDQPLFNEDKSLVLLCNGEVFNYRQLKHHLQDKGHFFCTETDVETLVHMYEECQEGFLNQVNGQFAFVIYNRATGGLFLARDQFGICPLYFTVRDGMFIFASEIKAILQHPLVCAEVDLTGLDQVLSLPGPISPRTMFQGIESLPPGHHLIVTDGAVRITEYWDLEYPKVGECEYARPDSYYEAGLRSLFEQSVKYRLHADVPVGFYLSGGLDSSFIAAMIRSLSAEVQRHSFSISFSDDGLCESRYQRLMAGAAGSIHHEIAFDDAEIAAGLRSAVYYSESPLKESYNTASLALSRFTKENGISVVLNGEGSDELFAGYVGYRFDRRRAEGFARDDLDKVLGDELRDRLWGDPNLDYEKDLRPFREVRKLLYSDGLNECFKRFAFDNFAVVNKERLEGRHPVHKRSYLDFKLRLAGHLIADHGDRMAMANSVEARYPFLDIDLVDFCATIPPELKLKGYTEKYILKKAAESYVPQAIVDREKFAFAAPGTPSLLQHQTEWVWDLLSYDRIARRGYFNPNTVERLKEQYSQPGFKLNLTLEDDLLMVVLTFGLFEELFNLGEHRC